MLMRIPARVRVFILQYLAAASQRVKDKLVE
jgi:hypothetical protein